MQCILTGFDPFDGASENPSQQAVERVAERIEGSTGRGAVSVTKLILPTCCDLAWETLQRHVKMLPPADKFVLVMSGFASKREKITPERYALNVRDYRIADNRGHRFDEQPIAAEAPELLRTNLALGTLVAALNAQGMPAETSYHAGTFVCNELYFRALNGYCSHRQCEGVLFVHFPSPENYAKVFKDSTADALERTDAPETSVDPIEHFARALTETIRLIAARKLVEGAAATAGG